MHSDVYDMLNRITIFICGNNVPLEIIQSDTLVRRNQTACVIYPYSEKAYIRLHENELNNIYKHIEKRGYDRRYLVLEVLLHEICHFKQYKKFTKNKRIFKSFRYQIDTNIRKEYHEKVADRYGQFCRKIIVKDMYNMQKKIRDLKPLTL